jgi:hypothetical protein
MKFTSAEDILLRDLVNRFGPSNWKVIAAHLPTRNARQCRERWSNYLDPTVADPKEWTPEEDARLEIAWAAFGPRWTAIAACFPGRSTFNVKNRIILMQRRERQVLSTYVHGSPVDRDEGQYSLSEKGDGGSRPAEHGQAMQDRQDPQDEADEFGFLARLQESLDDLFPASKSDADDLIPGFFDPF